MTSPDEELDSSDRGDDTLKRYGYQIYYSILVSLSILNDENKLCEVFCEQFEDVLVKDNSEKFIGIQVKTRDLDLGPFSSNDEAIVKSITRFVQLNKTFPDRFSKFLLTTNTGFFTVRNHKNLNYLIELAKANNSEDIIKNRSGGKKLVTSIAKKIKCTNEEVIETLAKIVVQKKYATLDNIDLFVMDSLSKLPIAKDQNPGVLRSIVSKLFDYHFKASSLSHNENLVSNYLKPGATGDNKVKSIIEGKRITRSELTDLIKKEIKNPVTLYLKDNVGVNEIPKTSKILELKMDAGKISAENIRLMKDLQYSVETYMVGMLHKDGIESANKKYNQIKLIVNNECMEAHDKTKNITDPFGTSMLVNLRKRLKKVSKKDKNGVFNARYEHLVGMSGILTEECKVWWSEKFPIV